MHAVEKDLSSTLNRKAGKIQHFSNLVSQCECSSGRPKNPTRNYIYLAGCIHNCGTLYLLIMCSPNT